jgi:hypothetical protein
VYTWTAVCVYTLQYRVDSTYTVALTKFSSRVCIQKCTPKKTVIKKNSTVRNREFGSLFLTVEFFFIAFFFSL